MAGTEMSIRTDSELKAQAEQVSSHSSDESMYTGLLRAIADREQGNQGRVAADVLADMDNIIAEAEKCRF